MTAGSTIELLCECGQRLTARTDNAGKAFKCPTCGRSVQVPASAEREAVRHEVTSQISELSEFVRLLRFLGWMSFLIGFFVAIFFCIFYDISASGSDIVNIGLINNRSVGVTCGALIAGMGMGLLWLDAMWSVVIEVRTLRLQFRQVGGVTDIE